MAVWNLAQHPTYKSDKEKRIEKLQQIMRGTNFTWKSWSEYLEEEQPFQLYPIYRGRVGHRYISSTLL